MVNSPQTGSKSQEFDLVKQAEKDGDELKRDSQMVTPPQTGGQSQEFELIEKTKKEKTDSQIVAALTNESRDGTCTANKMANESQVRDKHKTREGTDDNLSQEDSQVITPSSSDSQSLRRSRRSKASSEAAECEDKTENKDSLGSQSRSNSQSTLSAVGQAEARIGGRTRRSKVREEQSKSSPISTPESSQSLDIAGSTESSRGRGRYSRRRSSQAFASLESSESESPGTIENSPTLKKRGRKPRASLQSPLTLESKEDKTNKDILKDDSEASQKADTQSIESTNTTDLEDSQITRALQDYESLQYICNIEDGSGSPMEVEVDVVIEKTDADNTQSLSVSPHMEEQRQTDSKTNIDNTCPQESDTGDLESAEMLESVGISTEQAQEQLLCDPSVLPAVDTLAPPDETTEKLQASESSEEKSEQVSEAGDYVTDKQNDDSDSNHQEHPVEDAAEDSCSTSFGQNQMECPNVTDDFSKEEEEQSASINEGKSTNQHTQSSAADDITPLQESDKDSKTQIVECQDEEETQTANTENDVVTNLDAALADVCNVSGLSESTSKDVFQGSPAKQKDLEAVTGPDVAQSPSSGRTRGTWSPSASPSTSILKKGQKRPLEDETPSPLVKVSDGALVSP